MTLNEKNAIVTGASRGIGRATAIELASAGVNVALVATSLSDAVRAVQAECESLGVKACSYACDVSSGKETKDLVMQIRKDFGSVEILVNNAGITKDGLMSFMSEDDFDRVVGVNLKGAFNMIKAVSGLMLRARCGRIINMSSVSGLMGNAGQVNYSASKAGLVGLTKSVAREFASKGITCNAIAPGFIETDMTKDIGEDNPLVSSIPLGRMGRPQEIAQAVRFLAESDYITGVVLRVDGGIAM